MYEKPLEDYEYPDPDDDPWDDHNEVVECPSCHAEVYEDAVRCPVCGEYVTHSTSPWSGQSTVWILLGLAGIVAVIFALV